MKTRTKLVPVLVAAVLAIGSARVAAIDSDPSPPPASGGGDYDAGRRAIEARDWNGAINSLTKAAQRDSRNADIQNLLGYAYRNSGQLDPAFKHYERALQLDPRHLGAHEYIGEAYLMANNPAKAEEHLAQLKRHCPAAACEPYNDLRKKIETYRARK
jgi:Flp pilus assembly protein TadD